MARLMADRKKGYPRVAKWAKIKGANKALKSGNTFKPDVEPKLKEYDDVFPEYDKLNDEKAKLKDVVVDLKKALSDNQKEISGWAGEIEKLTSTNTPAYNDFMKLDGQDPAEVLEAFAAFPADIQDAMNKRKALWDQIAEVGRDSINQVKKAGADYKSKAEGIIKKMKELENEAEQLESEIMTILNQYEAEAEEIDHPEIIKDIHNFMSSL
jgi:archaellum component FlaC